MARLGLGVAPSNIACWSYHLGAIHPVILLALYNIWGGMLGGKPRRGGSTWIGHMHRVAWH